MAILKKVICALLCISVVFASSLTVMGMSVDGNTGVFTSKEILYPEDYEKAFSKPALKDFANSTYKDSYYVIPGLLQTNVGNGAVCDSMVPQGICVAGDYLFISAYDFNKVYKSVLYVLDLKTREYVTTIVLNTKCHVGAISFKSVVVNGVQQGELYVADSSAKRILVYKYSTLLNCINSGLDVNDEPCRFDSTFPSFINPSFVTYFGGNVIVGNFTEIYESSDISKLTVIDSVTHAQKGEYPIPKCSQGVEFCKYNGSYYAFFSTSFGRYNMSKLRIYKMKNASSFSSFTDKNCLREVNYPNMLEDLAVYNGNLLVCYESAAKEYASASFLQTKLRVDRVTLSSPGALIDGYSVNDTYKLSSVSLSSASYTYDGKSKKPSVTVKDTRGRVVNKNLYTVTYSANKNPGTANVCVKAKGYYSGTLKKTFKIKLKKVSLSSLSPSKKSFKVKWKRTSANVSGYQIQYSTSSKFKSGNKTVTVSGAKKNSKSVKKLKSKKKYYVRIRTYKIISGKKYHSQWSGAKSVKTK